MLVKYEAELGIAVGVVLAEVEELKVVFEVVAAAVAAVVAIVGLVVGASVEVLLSTTISESRKKVNKFNLLTLDVPPR